MKAAKIVLINNFAVNIKIKSVKEMKQDVPLAIHCVKNLC
jgi:hypothetical protein